MTEAAGLPPKPRLADFLLRPSRLYAALDWRPSFVFPYLLLVACAAVYVEVGIAKAFPRLVPELLEGALVPESDLRRNLHRAFLALAFVGPTLFLPLTAFAVWIGARILRARQPFPLVLALVAWSALWIAVALLAKAALALATGEPDPPLGLGRLLRAEAAVSRALLALTNPFLVLAAVWTSRGLRAWGAGANAAGAAGMLPWAAWGAGLALLFGGGTRFAIDAPVPTADWPVVERGGIALRHPPGDEAAAATLAGYADEFLQTMAGRLGFELGPLRVVVYPDHETLERAAGEALHVRTTTSIRGTDLVYAEMPGRSAAVPRETGVRDLLRTVGTVQLAPRARGAPRWFVEGFVHAAVVPGSARLEGEYRDALRRLGRVPDWAMLHAPGLFASPDGAVLARSVVDHLAFVHGRDAPEAIMKDVVGGTEFRDALFSRTRLTTSALEAGWQEAIRRVLGEPAAGAGPDSTPPAD